MAQVQDSNYGFDRNSSDPHYQKLTEEPRMTYPRPHNPADALQPRSNSHERGSSRAPVEAASNSSQPQHIDEAVTTAFDTAHVDGIHPDLIAQITKNVIKQLKVNTETPTQFPPPPPPPAPPSPPSTQSGTSPQMSTRNVYTPPSPHKHPEYTHYGSPGSRSSMLSFDGPTSPTKDPASPIRDFPNRSVSPFSGSTGTGPAGRPAAISRPSTVEETTLERIWGPLFEADGSATARLGQFLRGLAVHMIEDYEPKESLVVTPEKMAKFYEDMRLPREAYPWSIIFDDAQSSISRMYRQLECQHHLVQESGHWHEKPDIPGLTPVGFQLWATMMIQAHPDEEFERLKIAALMLPINNPDDKKERFPKDISRRLFPATPNTHIQDLLIDAIEEHARVNIEKSPSTSTTRQQSPPERVASRQSNTSESSATPFAPNNIERERNPYSSTPSECGIDDLNTTPTPQSLPSMSASQPIERERKPYRAAAGGGRKFEDSDGSSRGPPPPDSRPPPPPSGPPPGSTHRSSSAASRPIMIPPPPLGAPSRAGTDYIPGPEAYSNLKTVRSQDSQRRRNHSPVPSMGFRRSEPDVHDARFGASSYAGGAMDDRYEERRGHGIGRNERVPSERGPSPGRRYVERSETIDPREARRSMYDTGEEWYRARSSTTGTRPW